LIVQEQYYRKNCDLSYQFILDKNLKNISKKANAIIVSIYNDYFTTPKQKEILHNILAENERKAEELRREKYNPDNLFKNNKLKEQAQEEQPTENVQIIADKEENILIKMINRVKIFLKKFVPKR